MDSDSWTSVAEWPREWIDVALKTYPRQPKIPLPEADDCLDVPLGVLLKRRRSRRSGTKGSVSLSGVGNLLANSFGITDDAQVPGSRRAYPSAGARFPVEAYVMALEVNDLPQGLYHYSAFEHCLERLGLDANLTGEVRATFGFEWIAESCAVVILTAELSRSAVKYGERAYRFACLEAGHLAQNLLLAGEAALLACTVVGGFADSRLIRLLDLQNTDEVPLATIVISGNVDA